MIRSCAWRFIDPTRRQATAVSSTPGLAKPCLMFFPSLCTRFIGIRYATYPEGKRCANLDAVLGRGARWRGPALAHERRGGASCRSSNVRNAPLATVQRRDMFLFGQVDVDGELDDGRDGACYHCRRLESQTTESFVIHRPAPSGLPARAHQRPRLGLESGASVGAHFLSAGGRQTKSPGAIRVESRG